MKKLLASIAGVVFAMFAFAGCTTATASTDGSTTGGWSSMIIMLVIIVVFYALMIIPEKKRKKKAQEMRDNIEVGDKITTIGGMVGKVVHVTDDKITFETGEDRVRIEITKWAISSNEGKGAKKETIDSEESIESK